MVGLCSVVVGEFLLWWEVDGCCGIVFGGFCYWFFGKDV